jgi:hypothetical protein
VILVDKSTTVPRPCEDSNKDREGRSLWGYFFENPSSELPYQSFVPALSLRLPVFSPFVLAAADAKVEVNGEGMVLVRAQVESVKSAAF